MSLEVLQERSQIREARHELERRDLSSLPPRWQAFFTDRIPSRKPKLGDWAKSWDLLRSLQFLEQNTAKDALIFDQGCFCCEMLPILHRAGYGNLVGADLNPQLDQMPYGASIDYRVEDFLACSLADNSAAAITSISVLEHGYQRDRLLDELARVLQPDGYFLVSFDYWPDKIDTGSVTFFDMSWTLFSREEVADFIAAAGERGLVPVGELEYAASTTPIRCAGFAFTFAWLVLQKRSS